MWSLNEFSIVKQPNFFSFIKDNPYSCAFGQVEMLYHAFLQKKDSKQFKKQILFQRTLRRDKKQSVQNYVCIRESISFIRWKTRKQNVKYQQNNKYLQSVFRRVQIQQCIKLYLIYDKILIKAMLIFSNPVLFQLKYASHSKSILQQLNVIIQKNQNKKMKKSQAHTKLRQTSKNQQSIDMDPYSTSIIDQLLNSNSQWRNQDQIVKLTFKAFKDFIDLHSNQIKDLKALITTRASKQEVSTGLSLKANVSDMSRIVQQISNNLDSKISYVDMNAMLGQYARKKQLNEIIMLNSMKNQMESAKSKNLQKNIEIKVIQARFDDLQKQICKKLGGCVTLPQFQQLIKIVQQKVNIAEMNDVLQNRVTKQYLSTCLQKKVSKSQIQALLAKKADVNDLQLIINSLQMKASLPTIEKLTQIIENKADRSDIMIMTNQKKLMYEELSERLNNAKSQLEGKVHQIHKQVQNSKCIITQNIKLMQKDNQTYLRNFITSNEMNMINNQLKNEVNQQISKLKVEIDDLIKVTSSHLNYQNFKRELTNQINLRKRCEEKIYEEIDDVRKRIEEISAKKLQKTQYFNFKSELAQQLDQKIETQHVQQAFNKWEVEITQKTQQDKQQIHQLIRRVQQSLADSISQNTKDIGQLMVTAARPQRFDQSAVQEIVRKNRRQIDQCRKTVDLSYSELRSKLQISQYQSDLLQIRKKFDSVQRQISLKANIKDVCVLADSKPNIQDVNKALKEVKQVLDTKTCQSDLQDVVKDQATINQTLLCQNIIGRWLWQSGEVKAGGLVPWQIQFANTVPDYYFWQKDKSSILVLVSGIYQITTSIFGRNSIPNLLINGDPLNSKQIQNMNTTNTSKKQGFKRKKDKESIGHKICQYVMLPARSRISVTVPQQGAQGFLNIKRL